MLGRMICLPPLNFFPFIASDPSVAVWRISWACALVLGAETLLLWRVRSPRAALLPLAGTAGCLALTIAAWWQSRDFIPVVCATSVRITDPELGQRLAGRAWAALHLNMIYQDLAIAACVLTLILLVWGIVSLALSARRTRAG